MSSSVQRELEEIERSQLSNKGNSGGPRRGSSIFAAADDNDASGPYGRPAYLTQPGDLLEDFPQDSNGEPCDDGVITSGKMSSGRTGSRNKPRLSEAARMQELSNSQDLPGGINHRPLVGGFAAAAYEAARSHHYSTKRTEERNASILKDRRPPCI
mmetsp:Transcript_4782/g.6193  ORF Transcript_4782/g.6193 Transcript_4782/m.6193 type:complete len:156 (+) Transcript_4782:192-659(+)